MQGITTTHEQGFQKVVFESIIDTVAGGGCLDPTGLSQIYTDGVVPAGTLVGVKDASTGLHKVVTITNGDPDTYDATPLGFTISAVKIDENPIVGICIEGVVRRESVNAAGEEITAGRVTDLKDDLPKITFV
jgi:hypothetical protein